MTCTQEKWLLPRNKEGKPDQRFDESFCRIINAIGDKTCQELRSFGIQTSQLQKQAATAGLELARAIFNEADYLDKNFRHKHYNQYGWRSKFLRKQAQEILETIGFKRNNANKLIKTAEWLTSAPLDIKEKEWISSLSPSHIYELSRMSAEGFQAAKDEVSYDGFHFSAGQQDISVRRLEELRRLYASTACTTVEDSFTRINQLQPAIDSSASSSHDLVEQLIAIVRLIDWSHPFVSQRLRDEEDLLLQFFHAIEMAKDTRTDSRLYSIYE